MKKLAFEISINSAKERVWETMLSHGSYEQWVAASWPNTTYEGEWKEGSTIKFIGEDQSGTLAEIDELKPYEYISALHKAVLNPGGVEDRDSDVAKGWIGTTESYSFTQNNGQTDVTVEINTKPEWEKMFSDGWPKALSALKALCEGNNIA
ncbi:MAG: SRPBCC domain-containing protein [Chitinophagaceae bacterium]